MMRKALQPTPGPGAIATGVAATLSALLSAGAVAQTSSLQDLAGSLAQPGATVIYTAREFITMDPKKPRAEAVAVQDGKFVAVGTRAEVAAAAGKEARLDDIDDKVVIAGFVEQHVHPVLAALTMNTKVISIEDWDAIDGFSPAVRDEKTYQARLRAAIAGHTDKSKPFITWGYHHYFHGPMNRALLDQLAPDFPVIVWHRSAHEFFLNSAALRLMKIDDALVDTSAESAQEQLDLEKGHFFEQGGMAILPNITPHPRLARAVPQGTRVHRGLLPPQRHHARLRAGRLPVKAAAGRHQRRLPRRRDPVQPLLHRPTARASTRSSPMMRRVSWPRPGRCSSWGEGRTWYLPDQVKLLPTERSTAS